MDAPFIRLSVRDTALAALALGVILALYPGEGLGFSVAAGGVWAALNFFLLALLVVSISGQNRPSRLFIFMLACAKIPASYYLLYWLYRAEYLEPVGLTAGITLLPVVLLFRGLILARDAGTTKKVSEEGR